MATGTWVPIESYVGAWQKIEDTSTVQNHPLGTRVTCKYLPAGTNPTGYATMGTAEFVYLKGVASTLRFSWVSYQEDGLTVLAVADAAGRLAIAQAANVANQYGWYAVRGMAMPGLVLASCAADVMLVLTATAGSLDDALVTGDHVLNCTTVGARLTSGEFDGTSFCNIADPYVANAIMAAS